MAGYAGYAYVRSVLWLTVIGSIGLGIASITFSQLFAYAREAIERHGIPDDEAPLYMNIYRLTLSLAWTIGPGAAAWVMIRYSYKGTFLVCAGFFLLLMMIVWFYVPARPPSVAASAARIPLFRLLRTARPPVLLLRLRAGVRLHDHGDDEPSPHDPSDARRDRRSRWASPTASLRSLSSRSSCSLGWPPPRAEGQGR